MSENIMTVERTPGVIATEIRTLHQQCQRMVVNYIIEIGRRLSEAKALVPHGEWGDWLNNEVVYSQSTANYYMQIFEEYGADQASFFGEAKSQTLGNLTYSKALKMIAIPEEEREAFVVENDVENISTRKLDQLIKERDEAQRDKKAVEEQLRAAQASVTQATEEREKVEKELEELKAKPIDVAVQEPDPAVIDEAKAEAKKQTEEELQEKINKAEEAAKKAKEKEKALKEQLDKLKTETDADRKKAVESAEAERDAALAKAADAEKALSMADPGTTEIKVLFEEVQVKLSRMIALMVSSVPDKKPGYQKALGVLGALVEETCAKLQEGAA